MSRLGPLAVAHVPVRLPCLPRVPASVQRLCQGMERAPVYLGIPARSLRLQLLLIADVSVFCSNHKTQVPRK